MNKVLGVIRANFLLLAVACIVLGAATAHTEGKFDWMIFVWCMLAGLAGQISVNAFNEYLDFKSGLDLSTERTPFSGGSGTLPSSPDFAGATMVIACVSLLVACSIGLYLVSQSDWPLLALGIMGAVLVVFYTRYITKSAFLCLVAPGLAFGFVMVAGTHYAMAGSFSPLVILMSSVMFFLVNNLLLLNQFPDEEADKQFGRNHLVVHWGKQRCIKVLQFNALGALLSILLAVLWLGDAQPQLYALLFGLLPLSLYKPILKICKQHFDDSEKLQPAMGMNVAVNLITPVVLTLCLVL